MNAVARSAAAPVQAAVYARLTGDEVLTAMVTGGYDYVPEDAKYPYWVLGDAIETPDNTLDTFGRQVANTVTVWSDYRGYAQALAVGARIIELLDHQPLAVEGHTNVAVRAEMGQAKRDPNPRIRSVPVRFRVSTEQEM